MEPLKTFGEKLRAKRLERNLTQEQLGELVGLQKSGIAKYENGRIRNVSTEMASRFADALGVSVHELLDSFDRNLYALDFCVSEDQDGVWVGMEGHKAKAFFTHNEWARIRSASKLSAVLMACQEAEIAERKKAPDTLIDVESLSEDKRYLIEKIIPLSDDKVRSLRTIVDQVLVLRGD